jgi:hypothetical protein
LKSSFRLGMRRLMRAGVERPPDTIEEWARHARMAILAYSAYYETMPNPFDRLVGGGADAEWLVWPRRALPPTSAIPGLEVGP